mgnify:CR=1 FL=1
MVEKTCRTLRELLGQAGIRYELVLVDDGSSDGTWAAIEKVSGEDKNVTGVHFQNSEEAAIVDRPCTGMRRCGGCDGL